MTKWMSGRIAPGRRLAHTKTMLKNLCHAKNDAIMTMTMTMKTGLEQNDAIEMMTKTMNRCHAKDDVIGTMTMKKTDLEKDDAISTMLKKTGLEKGRERATRRATAP
jgi:hypothetical protein